MKTSTSVAADGWRAVERVIDARYSCRAYLAKPVPRATIEHVLRQSQRTASWCNSQAWELVITEGAGTERFRAALSAHAAAQMADRSLPAAAPDIAVPERYEGVYRARRRECGFRLYDSVGIAHDDRAGSAREYSRISRSSARRTWRSSPRRVTLALTARWIVGGSSAPS